MAAKRSVIRLVRKKKGSCLEYFELWVQGDVVIVHTGEVGDLGETRKVAIPSGSDANQVLAAEIAAATAADFRDVRGEDFVDVVLQYPLEEDEPLSEQLGVRHMIEELVSQTLGWAGLGYCTGGDIGGG